MTHWIANVIARSIFIGPPEFITEQADNINHEWDDQLRRQPIATTLWAIGVLVLIVIGIGWLGATVGDMLHSLWSRTFATL